MPRLHISPIGKTIEAEDGTTVLEALLKAGIDIPSPCGGQHLCGKCRVRVADGEAPPDSSETHLTAGELAAGIRLACRTVIRDDLAIELPDNYSMDIRILESERIHHYPLAPAVAIREEHGHVHLVRHDGAPMPLAGWQGDRTPKGIAIDLGTTTLVATLMDLQSGVELSTASAVNPQVRYGHDVMTRIHRASTDAGLGELCECVTARINDLIDQACRTAGVHPLEIVDAVVGGNTAMLQIASAISPAPLGTVPFTVDIHSGESQPAGRFRLAVNPGARVYIPPVAHAFVGADISAGLLSVDFFEKASPVMFIDVGTNGEMALAADGKWIVTSTAAGPAFEGMGITHGMNAAPGAIESIRCDDGFWAPRTIDHAPARGLCGSGIIDLVACLLQTGDVSPDGRLHPPGDKGRRHGPFDRHHDVLDGVTAIRLTDSVCFTQKDIRQFQLAKSAIQTGMALLLAAAGVPAERLAAIIIAGAFGNHLREESLRRVGMLPRGFAGEVGFAGNTCRTGCIRLLLDAAARDDLQRRMASVTHLSIAESPDFQNQFIDNMALQE